MRVGDVFHHAAFYLDGDSGELRGKYLLILALPARTDVVVRLLTSRYPELRPEACHHGPPYPGFFLDVPGAELKRKTWLDLRGQDDLDAEGFRGGIAKGTLRRVLRLHDDVLRGALDCAARADDTTGFQARHIQDALAALGT